MALRQIFAENLRRARLAAGMSQEELADVAGIDRTYVSALERCRYAASIDVIERLATALQVTAASLLEDTEHVPPRKDDT
ncbi:XRE family transcriptional regulator [Erythrobacter litoralis]|uniref:XRE family transcriptional regulator n=1 Tax=Erythrobacter litoralis TaxID=39960 RepID=A0A074N5K9_9SPHN|nr:helix-turn-helix transcriptional regulator [Erythrobacter litoralis]KEO93267.1 XRE family transcriptional regulator [Erythrobacter litoralis]